MKISYDGKRVTLKTEHDDLFEAEKSGAKPNTVRIIDADEYKQLKKHKPKKIIIQHQQEIFVRTITYVYVSEQILGKYLTIFSWNPSPKSHPELEATDHGFEAHTIGLDQEPQIDLTQSSILLPRTLIHELIDLAGDRPLPELIASMLNEYNKPEQESTDHEAHNVNSELAAATTGTQGFRVIFVSKQMLHLLETIGHGRSMNEIIQELYEEHLYHDSFTKGLLHD